MAPLKAAEITALNLRTLLICSIGAGVPGALYGFAIGSASAGIVAALHAGIATWALTLLIQYAFPPYYISSERIALICAAVLTTAWTLLNQSKIFAAGLIGRETGTALSPESAAADVMASFIFYGVFFSISRLLGIALVLAGRTRTRPYLPKPTATHFTSTMRRTST